MTEPYDNPNLIERLYHGEGLTVREVAERLGCSPPTMFDRMDKFGIETRGVGGVDTDADYRDPDVLRGLYVDQGMTTYEVADELGTTPSTVRYWMDKFDIPRREKWHHARSAPAYYCTDSNGYECWQVQSRGDRHQVRVHRLAAVAWFGLDALDGLEVHHKNGVKWDTREDNIELMSGEDHARLHAHETEFWKYRDGVGEADG